MTAHLILDNRGVIYPESYNRPWLQEQYNALYEGERKMSNWDSLDWPNFADLATGGKVILSSTPYMENNFHKMWQEIGKRQLKIMQAPRHHGKSLFMSEYRGQWTEDKEKNMSDFKVGDEVRVTLHRINDTWTTTITEVDGDDVKFAKWRNGEPGRSYWSTTDGYLTIEKTGERMTEFKVGDRVIINNRALTQDNRGIKGTITRLHGDQARIDLDDGRQNYWLMLYKIDKLKEEKVTKFKVGDTVRCNTTNTRVGAGFRPGREFVVGEVVKFTNGTVYHPVERGGGVWEEDLTLVRSENMKYKVGDEFEDNGSWAESYTRTIIHTFEYENETHHVLLDNDGTKDLNVRTARQIDDSGWSLKTEEVELTLQDIAAKFGVDVSKVRIKE